VKVAAESNAALAERTADARARIAPVAGLYPFQPRFVRHGTVWQHYVDEAPRGAEDADHAVLCLHGNPTWSFAWRRLVLGLRATHRVIAPDHVGCGLSDKPRPYAYTLEQHVENLERLVDAAGLRRVTLVLHDWGGAIGMGFARRHPERIARLVVTNTAAFRSARIPLRIALCRVPVLGRIAVQGMNAFARAATFMAVETPLPPEVKRGYLLPYDGFHARIATHRFVADIPLAPGHPSWDELVAIEAALPSFADRPAAILWGDRDWCFTPAFRERWRVFLPGARVRVFPAAGHYVMEDAGDELVACVVGFLEATA